MTNQPKCNLCQKVVKIILNYNYPFYMRPAEGEIEILPLKIGFCQSCNHIMQLDPPTEKLKEVYSKFYRTYHSTSQEQIKDFADFVGRGVGSLLEIGCLDGQFLNLMKGRKVYGCDPNPLVKPSETIKRDFFSKDLFGIKFDCIVARHVLEHIEDLNGFIKDIRLSLGGGKLAIEVPNVSQVLANGSIGAFSHEHINYFTLQSLNNYLNSRGFKTISVCEHKTSIYWLGEIEKTTISLVGQYLKKVTQLKTRLADVQGVYIYGAGGHTSCLLNLIPLKVKAIIDKDKTKQGKHLPGFKDIPIYSSDFLKTLTNKDAIIISTELFQDEIIRDLRPYIDIGVKVYKLYPLCELIK